MSVFFLLKLLSLSHFGFLFSFFFRYGRIRDIDIKNPSRPPAYAFVSFSDYRDAEDAVRGRDGYNFDGHRLRVELAKGIHLLFFAFSSATSFSKYLLILNYRKPWF